MEIKFTPWRMAYVTNADAPAEAGCVLCARGQGLPEPSTLVLYRGARLREHRHRPGFLRVAHAWFLPAGRLR